MKTSRFFIEEDLLFRRGFNQAPFRCIVVDEVAKVLRDFHAGDCGEHQGNYRLFKQIGHLGYYWPTMEPDTMYFTRKYLACQLHNNRIHAPAVELYSLSTPWPYICLWSYWSIDSPSLGYIWNITAIEYYTKWVKVVALQQPSGAAVSNLILDNVICRFGICKRILSDNGTPFF